MNVNMSRWAGNASYSSSTFTFASRAWLPDISSFVYGLSHDGFLPSLSLPALDFSEVLPLYHLLLIICSAGPRSGVTSL